MQCLITAKILQLAPGFREIVRLEAPLYLLASDFEQSVVLRARRVALRALAEVCRFSSVVEQLIRNERVNGSNPLSGSPCSAVSYLLKLTHLGILTDVRKGTCGRP